MLRAARMSGLWKLHCRDERIRQRQHWAVSDIRQRAESCRSLQVRNRKGSANKADAQGISQFFLLCKRGEWQQGAHFTDFLFCSECRLLWSGQERAKTGEGFAQVLCPYTL
jgi:hypothetical protein